MLTSGEVARKLGVSIVTVKNYEKKGILLPDKRLPSGRRYYDITKVNSFCESMKVKGDS